MFKHLSVESRNVNKPSQHDGRSRGHVDIVPHLKLALPHGVPATVSLSPSFLKSTHRRGGTNIFSLALQSFQMIPISKISYFHPTNLSSDM